MAKLYFRYGAMNSGKTTALTGTISGLNDFELISFLVIQEAE